MSTACKTTSGFTLIEISIVLVIIGLVVGGILTGRDLIDTAQQRAQITQIEKYNTAVHAFQNKYGGLPGDLALNLANQFGFYSGNCNGDIGWRDGNGLLDGWHTANAFFVQLQGEVSLFWQDLSTAQLIDTTIPNNGATPTSCQGGSNVPVLSLAPGTLSVGDYFPAAKIGNGNYLYTYETNGSNWYGLSGVTSVSSPGGLGGTLFSSTTISVAQAYNMDKKIDDGIPVSGNVQTAYLNNSDGHTLQHPHSAAADDATTCYNTTANTYSIGVNGGNGQNCALSFKFQ